LTVTTTGLKAPDVVICKKKIVTVTIFFVMTAERLLMPGSEASMPKRKSHNRWPASLPGS
jgi:hypothetical protein